jgi:hypothetical protein
MITGFGPRGDLPSPLRLPLPLSSPPRPLSSSLCAPFLSRRASRAPRWLTPAPRSCTPQRLAPRAARRLAPRDPSLATVVARRSTFSLIHFNFSLVVVLCSALRRATIHFKSIFINELCRALCRATFLFKFSSDDVCRRAFRRATLNVYL